MASRTENVRAVLKAEGASETEITEYLAEMRAEEGNHDSHSLALRHGIPQLYAGAAFKHIEMDSRAIAIRAACNWSIAITSEDTDELARRRRLHEGFLSQPDLLRHLAAGDTHMAVPRGLYLWSDDAEKGNDLTGFGTGKTEIAAAITKHILTAGKITPRWVSVARAMPDLNFPFAHPTYAAAASRLGRPTSDELIVLDDIDKQPPTDRNLQPIFALVNDCVNDMVPLVITANRHPDDLAADWGARFGHAVASRIIGHCLDIEVNGPDRRLA